MRILFFLNVLGGGGAEMHFVRMASELSRHGIEPVFATIKGGGAYENLLDPSIAHHVLDGGGSSSTVRKLFAAVRPLARLIDELKPDVLCPVLSLTTIPAIIACRLASHKASVVLSIQNALGKQVFSKRTPIALAQQFLIPHLWAEVDGIIAISQGVASDIAHYVPKAANLITVINNCGKPMSREIENVAHIAPDKPKNRPLLVAVGRLTEQKDYPTMFAAMDQLKTSPTPLLRVLGTGEDEKELHELIRTKGLDDRVEFLGFRTDALAHMRAADLFLLSSQWEGFANVIVEAMSMGTTVVATDCPHGPSEIISQGVNGTLVPVGDSIAFAEAIDSLLDDRAKLDRLAIAGQRRADDFSVVAIAAKYAETFRRLSVRQSKSDI